MTGMNHWEFMGKNKVQNELKTLRDKKKTENQTGCFNDKVRV